MEIMVLMIVILILAVIIGILWVVKLKGLLKAHLGRSDDPADPGHESKALRARKHALRNRHIALTKRSRAINDRLSAHSRKEDALTKFIHSTMPCARELDAAIFVQLRAITFEKGSIILEIRELQAEWIIYKSELEALQTRWSNS
ncbi:uncharacterized protein N7496_003052 [Penicillium cataractarum]|uniref:Uncharacterized protein n=1 Tax=Penicillium cataractarum TaxID=2100454 RepID=A0A9W9SMW4_9EURO|nr:uncharacterized protein N7496_003052 [Penicillium cataractarum]KAJ5380624.1 hypothetical protein N7496_003052 [Penicillium cataractarum]